MCRFFDNAFSGFNAHRISTEDYNEMQAADNRFNTLLAEIQEDVKIGAGFGPVMGRQDEVYDGVNDTIQADSRISLEENAKAATRLSHLTNDRIRYNSSGVEKRREKNEQAMRDELGDIAECGGSRQVTFRAGVDALFKLDIKIASLKVRGGGSVAIGAKIAATNPDGSVSVTYSFGGQGHLEGSHKIGSDPDAKGDKASPGLGAELKGEVKIDGTYSVTKTYKNLDDFIKTASSLNLVMTPRPREAFYAWGRPR